MRTAAYCRFSSDKQNETSIDDQLRNIRAFASRHGWSEPRVFCDREITGARSDRLQYRTMLQAAGEFSVLLVDDMNRLARDQVELPRVVGELTFRGVRVIGVTDGFDNAREGYKLELGMRGIMGEAQLDALAKNTHRGLMGKALQGRCAGGLPYGYRVTSTGQRDINPAEAHWVVEIYKRFAAGETARAIAAELNRVGAPAARGGTWSMTAIYGDRRRGIGILANEIYRGRMIWNRSKWTKNPLNKNLRSRFERPKSEWVVSEHPELRIIDEDLWQAVERRFAEIHARTGGRKNPGAKPKYVLSGLMVCGVCGASMVVVDRYRYGCAANKDRGPDVCSNNLRVARARAETVLLQTVREELLSEQAFRAFESEARRVLKETAPDPAAARRALQEAERIRANLIENIRQGVVSPAVRAELLKAEAAVSAAQEALSSVERTQPSQMLPRARETWKRLVANVEKVEAVSEAREALRELLGTIKLTPENGGLVAELGVAQSEIAVVAGAGFEPATFGL